MPQNSAQERPSASLGSQPEIPTEADLNADYSSPEDNVGVNMKALAELAKHALNKQDYPVFALFRAYSSNKIFTLTFEDGTEAIARCPFPKYYHRPQMETEIPTMIFARQYYDIPIPRLYAWSMEQGDASPVGAPFILMERLPGRSIRDDEFWVRMDEETRLKLLRSVPATHLELTKPLPPSLQHLGNIRMRDLPSTCRHWDYESVMPLENFEVAPYIESQSFRGSWHREGINRILPMTTFGNIAEFWLETTELEFLELKRHFSKRLTQEEPYVLPGSFVSEPGHTASDLANAYRDLRALLGHYLRTHDPKHRDFRLCLWHHDFKFDNLLFDPETFRVTGLIDWENASIVPRILSARYPRDLECGGVPDDPTGHGWLLYTKEFTVTFPSEYSLDFFIDSTWYRFFYSGLLADKDVQLSTRYWKESEMALKLKEIVDEGFVGWLNRKEWLAETVAKIAEDTSTEYSCT